MHFLRESPAGNGRVNTYGIEICSLELHISFPRFKQSIIQDCPIRENELQSKRTSCRGNELQFERTDCLIQGNELQSDRTSCPIWGNKLLIDLWERITNLWKVKTDWTIWYYNLLWLFLKIPMSLQGFRTTGLVLVSHIFYNTKNHARFITSSRTEKK